jgi:hypothetical protein
MAQRGVSVTPPQVLARIDHLVYAAADLGRGIVEIERLLGVRASVGGRHPLWGTRNALASLGPSAYLEIIAPDPNQLPGAGGRPFGLDARGSSRLVGWAAKGSELANLRDNAAQHGVELGKVLSGSRVQPDGAVLTWMLTDPRCVVGDGIAPFFIDWGKSPHPARFASPGAALVGLRAEHPDAERVRRMLRVLAVDLLISAGPVPALLASIDCPQGRVILK